MSSVYALENQSLIDLAIQTTGLAENYLKIAIANNLVPTGKLSPGQKIVLPENMQTNADIVRYYRTKNITPATSLSNKTKSEEIDVSCEEQIYECFK